jgi:hypothetical protein
VNGTVSADVFRPLKRAAFVAAVFVPPFAFGVLG